VDQPGETSVAGAITASTLLDPFRFPSRSSR
jgi:hypothetical protein